MAQVPDHFEPEFGVAREAGMTDTKRLGFDSKLVDAHLPNLHIPLRQRARCRLASAIELLARIAGQAPCQ